MSTVVNDGFNCAQRTGWKFVMFEWGQTSELSAYCIPGNLQLRYLWSKLLPFLLTPNPAGNHKALTRDHCFLCSNTFLTPCYPSKSSSPSFIGFVVLSNTLHQPVLDFSLHIQGFLVSELSWYQIFAGSFIDAYHFWENVFMMASPRDSRSERVQSGDVSVVLRSWMPDCAGDIIDRHCYCDNTRQQPIVTKKNFSLLVNKDHNGKQLASKAVHFCFNETVVYALNFKLSSSCLICSTFFSAVTSKNRSFCRFFWSI